MGRALILTSVAKAGTTGGTFADTLTAATPDTTTVGTFTDGGARILEFWGMDDTSVAEIQMYYSRPLATHDQVHGLRAQIASKLGTTAGKIGAQELLPGNVVVNLFPSDVPTIQASTTASDNIAASYTTLYDDLPGVSGTFISPSQAASLQSATLGIYVNAAGSATHGAYGTARAFNADDNRLRANTWYAILGYTMQLPVMTVSLTGLDWGGQRIGGPGDPLTFRTADWFQAQSAKWGLPLIPCFNSNNAGGINVQICDAAASVTPVLDFVLYQLSSAPTPGQ